ncbi:HNH endonuclease family protein [Frankia sp. AgKG'84/4]|uniref:hypothetical protein n=1 Tax=Frankia sp. AgKG'84/4 TaxID=573490 RepID=UPI00200D25EC|nr:hypothetical protein [Frankia sp. AgKG'84/4]MCL9795549.1 hypothetical protein [Frankia sp. AgKG'84/4]
MRPVFRNAAPSILSLYGRASRSAATVVYDYHAYGGALLERLGEYCSYCEVALCGNAAIEHMAGKGFEPQFENAWNNLLLACTNCNSRKAVKGTSINIGDFLWPCDLRIDTSTAFRYHRVNGLVLVAPAAGTLATRAAATIDLFGLNNVPAENDRRSSDRRVRNRTNAWDSAVTLADRYVQAGAATGGFDQRFPRLLAEQIKAIATTLGFWSVWMTVFENRLNEADLADPIVQGQLDRLFCEPFTGTLRGRARATQQLPYPGYTGLPVMTKAKS